MSTDAPTPLDLDAIRAMLGDRLAVTTRSVALDLLAEVERLRAEVRLATTSAHSASLALGAQLTARPAPAWDEEAMRGALVDAQLASACQMMHDGHPSIFVRSNEDAADVALAVVRDHLPVKPGREDVARALALVGDYDGCFERRDAWAAASAEARECGDVEEPMSTDAEDAEWWLKRAEAALDLLPGRSEAEVKAEALREARDAVRASSFWADGSDNYADRVRGYLSARADRLSAEGGADRG